MIIRPSLMPMIGTVIILRARQIISRLVTKSQYRVQWLSARIYSKGYLTSHRVKEVLIMKAVLNNLGQYSKALLSSMLVRQQSNLNIRLIKSSITNL